MVALKNPSVSPFQIIEFVPVNFTRLDEFFYKELSAGSGAVHVPYSVAATDATGTPTTREGGKFLPATPEISIYDFDGNLTSDGRFTYTWDAENRLIAMQTLVTVPVIAQRKLAFAYDAMCYGPPHP